MANFIYASLSNANKNPIGIHPNEMTCSVLFVQKKAAVLHIAMYIHRENAFSLLALCI